MTKPVQLHMWLAPDQARQLDAIQERWRLSSHEATVTFLLDVFSKSEITITLKLDRLPQEPGR